MTVDSSSTAEARSDSSEEAVSPKRVPMRSNSAWAALCLRPANASTVGVVEVVAALGAPDKSPGGAAGGDVKTGACISDEPAGEAEL
jgi:hypothetical protein